MDAEDHFARLDDLDRELKEGSGVHLVDIDTIDIDADEEAVEVTPTCAVCTFRLGTTRTDT
jgi:hypothetical protein